jgi:hypothetical protein
VAIVLTRLRASADWGAIAAEYLYGEPPATDLGQAEAAFSRAVGTSPRHGREPRTSWAGG